MVDESKKSLQVQKIGHFSGFHNFTFESSRIRARRAYKIGRGKLFPYDTVFKAPRGDWPHDKTLIKHFLSHLKKDVSRLRHLRMYNLPLVRMRKKDTALFECVFPGCRQAFEFFSDLEQQHDEGKHTSNQETTKKSDSLRD